MEFLGKQQIVPGQAKKRMEEDHLARYKFAAEFVENKEVLDIACGVGYGARFLKEAGAQHVDGIDISEKAINFAKFNYSTEGVDFFVSNAVKYVSEKKYDIIVSFETIQFIDNFRALLKNFYNLLRSGGVLIISTVNRIVTSPYLKDMNSKPSKGVSWAWDSHFREFLVKELSKELKDCGFIIEGTFGQRQRLYFKNKYLRRLHKMIFNPDVKTSPAVEKIRKIPRFFIIKAVKP